VRSRTPMAGSPRLAAIRKIACSEDAQGICPACRARRAASQPVMASGWPVLMLAPVLMMRRKASRCRKFWWLMIKPGGGGAGQDAAGGSQELADQLVNGNRGGVHGDASREEWSGGRGVSPGRLTRGAGSCQVTRPARAERGVPGWPADRIRASTGAAADLRARPPRDAAGVSSQRGAGGRPHARRTASGSG